MVKPFAVAKLSCHFRIGIRVRRLSAHREASSQQHPWAGKGSGSSTEQQRVAQAKLELPGTNKEGPASLFLSLLTQKLAAWILGRLGGYSHPAGSLCSFSPESACPSPTYTPGRCHRPRRGLLRPWPSIKPSHQAVPAARGPQKQGRVEGGAREGAELNVHCSSCWGPFSAATSSGTGWGMGWRHLSTHQAHTHMWTCMHATHTCAHTCIRTHAPDTAAPCQIHASHMGAHTQHMCSHTMHMPASEADPAFDLEDANGPCRERVDVTAETQWALEGATSPVPVSAQVHPVPCPTHPSSRGVPVTGYLSWGSPARQAWPLSRAPPVSVGPTLGLGRRSRSVGELGGD
nr:uncharacterized protein LOC107974525 [Pan troglodytes]XP_016808205.2 uncharacterized protein LOC107974525 [Pan troglodytes]XP_054539651.1 uncharacterized protein LOC107974525 [Pan troglodytes]